MRGALATNPSDLAVQAAEVLRRNDMGGWTRAAPNLYPHQWSWDTGFIAIGLAHLDTSRAAGELTSLFRHQWTNGKVPHIVFNPDAPPDSYFPGRPARAAVYQRPVPAADPRPRRPARVGAGRERPRRPRVGVPARHLPEAAGLAPLPCHGTRPRGIRARDDLPPLGERHGQLSEVGSRPPSRRDRRPPVVRAPGLEPRGLSRRASHG